MILRKPYAFFIKHFRLIHLIMAILGAYSIYRTKIILDFFNSYTSTFMSVINQDLVLNFMYGLIFLIPIFIIIITAIVMFVMSFKKKPYTFYLINILIYAYLFIILIVVRGILLKMGITLVDVRSIRLSRDLLTVAFIVQIINLMIVFIRAVGFDIKKFDFRTDLQELQIDDLDNEEFEFSLGINKNKTRRKLKRITRKLKYIYKENKMIIKIASSLIIASIVFATAVNVRNYNFTLSEKTNFTGNGLSLSISDSFLTNTDYKGNVIDDRFYYLIVRLKIKNTTNLPNKIDIATTKIVIDKLVYTPSLSKRDLLFDFGNIYQDELISHDYQVKSLIYEIPKQLIDRKIVFSYITKNKIGSNKKAAINVLIAYKNLTKIHDKKSMNLNEEIALNSVNNYKFNIKSYDVSKSYILKYNYCINSECIESFEHLKPSLTSNYNKAILKVEGSLTKDGTDVSGVYNLYDIINNFGKLNYVINNKNYTQNIEFKKIVSKKVNDSNVYYIEVVEELMKADKISIEFKFRNEIFEYILK